MTCFDRVLFLLSQYWIHVDDENKADNLFLYDYLHHTIAFED